jgi:branched-chain amino acid transport system substrate-binding protein
MDRNSWRFTLGLGLAVVLVTGSACGTRLEKTEIVSAYRGTEGAGAAGTATDTGRYGTGVDQGAAGTTAAVSEARPTANLGTTAGGGSGSASNSAAPGAAARSSSGSGSGATGAVTPGAGSAAASGSAAAQPGAKSAAGTPGAASPGAGGAAPAAPATPGAPIVVGSVGTSSGIVGAALGPGLPAVRAWVAMINAGGGIKGHPVKHVFADDGGDPARHRQLVQQMVERDKVVAFVFNFAPLSGQSSIDYLNQKRVPVIGDSGAAQWYYESPMFFPQFTTGRPYVEAMIRAAAAETVPQGKKKLAILNCQEAQFCVDADKLWPELAPKLGYELVFRRQTSLAQPDYTAECLAAKNAGAEVFGLAMDGNAIGRVASACGRSGFKPIYFIHHSTLLKEQASDPNTAGILVPIPARAYFDKTNPKVVRYQQALAKYAPGEEIRQNSFAGWVAAEDFELAANRAPDPTTSAGILEGLWSFNGETLDNITLPLTYPREAKTPQKICWYTLQGGNGKFGYTDKGQALTCS